MNGFVTIAGAGPGDIDHLTVGVLREIQSAQVILYDALLSQSIIAEFPHDATTIYVGKRCGNHTYTQTMIIAAMIEHAMAGRRVLRLKGGDPSVFAHLASEIAALEALDISYRILPGVSAMHAAAAELKRPLTLRQDSRHIWATDGHAADLERHMPAMAAFTGTLIFYMAAGRTAQIAELLIAHGMQADTPAALVENAGTATAVNHSGNLADFATGRLCRSTLGAGIFLTGVALATRTEEDTQSVNHASAPQL